jgi:hypothetical protein
MNLGIYYKDKSTALAVGDADTGEIHYYLFKEGYDTTPPYIYRDVGLAIHKITGGVNLSDDKWELICGFSDLMSAIYKQGENN